MSKWLVKLDTLPDIKPIGKFEVNIVYPDFIFSDLTKRKLLFIDIQSLMKKINQRHCS